MKENREKHTEKLRLQQRSLKKNDRRTPIMMLYKRNNDNKIT